MQCDARPASAAESAEIAQEQGYTACGDVGGSFTPQHPPPGLMFKAYRKGNKGAGIVWRARCCACAQCTCPEGACSCTTTAAGCEPCSTHQAQAHAHASLQAWSQPAAPHVQLAICNATDTSGALCACGTSGAYGASGAAGCCIAGRL